MTKALVPAEESRALTPAQERTDKIRGALVQRLPDLLPPGMSPDRFAAVTMLAIAKAPEIADCTAESIVMSVLEAAQYGLEPTGAKGGAHLVAFRHNVGTKQSPKWEKRAQLIYDYRGTQHLIREGGGGEVKAVLVYKGDKFRVVEGTGGAHIEHEPAFETTDPADILFVYAYPLDHPEKFEVMTKAQIDGVRARSKSANSGPWVTDYGQMGRKTCLNRLANYLELKPKYRALLLDDAEREFGDGVVSEPSTSRTASVKASLARQLGAGKEAPPASEPSGATENASAPSDTTPEASASQPTGEPAVADAGVVSEVCGATSDPKLGDVETCVLPPDHAFPDGKPSAHTSASGAKFPQKGAK